MMQPWGPSVFSVEKPNTEAFAPTGGWKTEVAPVSPWATKQQTKPAYADDENLKKQFGVEWAKCGKPFEAACKVFLTDTSAALWIASNWLTDPHVIAAKDVYLKAVDDEMALLDKDSFAAMLMKTALETNLEGTRYLIEAKERVNILKLYAEVRGFLNKNETNINNFNNNEGLKVVFVKPDVAATTIIEQPKQVPNNKSEILNEGPSPLKIRLVGNG